MTDKTKEILRIAAEALDGLETLRKHYVDACLFHDGDRLKRTLYVPSKMFVGIFPTPRKWGQPVECKGRDSYYWYTADTQGNTVETMAHAHDLEEELKDFLRRNPKAEMTDETKETLRIAAEVLDRMEALSRDFANVYLVWYAGHDEDRRLLYVPTGTFLDIFPDPEQWETHGNRVTRDDHWLLYAGYTHGMRVETLTIPTLEKLVALANAHRTTTTATLPEQYT